MRTQTQRRMVGTTGAGAGSGTVLAALTDARGYIVHLRERLAVPVLVLERLADEPVRSATMVALLRRAQAAMALATIDLDQLTRALAAANSTVSCGGREQVAPSMALDDGTPCRDLDGERDRVGAPRGKRRAA